MSTRRVVVVAPNWLGDAVMALPAIADVRASFAGAHVAVAARTAVAPLFTMVDGIDEVVTLPSRGGWGMLASWRDDAEALAAGKFDSAVLLPNSFQAALTSSMAGIPDRWGFATDWRRRWLTRAVPRARGPLHQAAYYQALTAALEMSNGPQVASVRAPIDEGRRVLAHAGAAGDAPVVAFAPGAAYGRAKQWLPERFAELARFITARGWHVALTGSRGDGPVCAEIASAAGTAGTGRVLDLAGNTNLAELAGVLAASGAVVANDSGAMHLAAAVGAPVVAVFGATNEARTSPLPPSPDAPRAVVVSHQVFCRPCMLRECPIDHRCMRGVTAARVFAEVEKMVKA